MLFLTILVIGMVSGWIAHWIIDRDAPIDWGYLLFAGLMGSLIGGTIGSLLFTGNFAIRPAGIIGSVIGATIVLALMHLAGEPKSKRRTR